MKTLLRIPATALIIVAGMSAGTTSANLQFSPAAISQGTCQARFIPHTSPIKDIHKPQVSTATIKPKVVSTNDWPTNMVELLETVNDARFNDGLLSIVDCVGGSDNIRVRQRDFELDHVRRQGSERGGWRFSAEAENINRRILRAERLELPPNYVWQLNKQGDGLIGKQQLFHPLSREDGVFFTRIRTTEVKSDGKTLHVSQLTSTDRRFDELRTWTLKPKHKR